MKKVINIKFLGFWEGFDPADNLFYNILKERYDIILSEKPDFLFFSPLCKAFEYMKYDCVRIMFTGEFYSADFNICDYSIDFDDISFGDRHIRYPLFLYERSGPYNKREKLTRKQAEDVLKSKKYFCNFIFGHDSKTNKRESFLDAFSTYKRVDCAGSYKNNMPNGERVTFGGTKGPFVQKSKFTLAIESVDYLNYCGEKITDAFINYSVPIYYGNKNVDKEFNTRAFVNGHDFASEAAVVEYVKKIDNNNELYIDMLTQPEFVQEDYPQKKYDELCTFLYNIFDNEPKDAYRRTRYYRSQAYENNLNHARVFLGSSFLGAVYGLFSKFFKR